MEMSLQPKWRLAGVYSPPGLQEHSLPEQRASSPHSWFRIGAHYPSVVARGAAPHAI